MLIVDRSKPFGVKTDCCGAPEGLVGGPEVSVEEFTNKFGPWTYARTALTGIVAIWGCSVRRNNCFSLPA